MYVSEGSAQAQTIAYAQPQDRARFIRLTYHHLAGSIAAFILIEAYLLQSPLAEAMMSFIAGNQYGWLLILGAFMICGWLARGFASSVESRFLQYVGLLTYIFAEAVIFVPLIYIAVYYSSPVVLPTAGILTALMFAGLTATAFLTRKDFSFLKGILTIGFFVAIGLIICATMFGFDLGLLFSAAMILLASGAILYDTSNVIHHYQPGQHVAAALDLFASVALLFWYILRLVMAFSRD